MSVARALRRFIGLPPTADDRTLLGLPAAPTALTPVQVQAALADRLLRIDRHPDREGRDAALVREVLRDAAARVSRAIVAPAAASASRAPASGASGQPASVQRSPSKVAPTQVAPTQLAPGQLTPGHASALQSAPSAPTRTPAPSPVPHPTPHPTLNPATAPAAATAPASASAGAPTPRAPVPPKGHPLARAEALRQHASALPVRPDPRAQPLERGAVALTAFDRMVLAVLVSNGGWNSTSKTKIAALAAQRGIGPDGLARIVAGLASHAHGAGGRPTASDLREGASMLVAGPVGGPAPLEPSRLEAIVEQLTERMGEELRSERWGPRMRVTAVFSILTLALLALLVRVLVTDQRPATAPPATATASTEDVVSPPTSEGSAMPATIDREREAPVVLPAKFERPPNFAGARRPEQALRLLEQSPGLPALIEGLGRRAVVAREGLSPAVEREWIAAIDEAGGCWPLMEVPLRDHIVASFAEALRGLDDPRVTDRLLAPLRGVEPPRSALGLWQGAFRVGVLSEIVARAAIMPPTLVGSATEALRALAGEARDAATARGTGGFAGGAGGFAGGAGQWLDLAVPTLVERLAAPGAEDRFADEWEAWIEAQRALRDGASLQAAYAGAVGALLRSGIDLSATGPASDVLGRLVLLLDLNDDRGVRAALLGWVRDPRVPSESLWVLTSLMLRQAGIRWFGSDLVLAWSASDLERGGLADSISTRWMPPAESSQGRRPPIAVSGDLLDTWRATLRELELAARGARTSGAAVRAVLLTAMLNQAAAAIELGQEQRGRELVAEIRAEIAAPKDRGVWPPRGGSSANPIGAPSGADGEWSRQHAEAERNLEQRLATLRQLRTRPGGDLGPRDAEVFVREVVRGSPNEVRSVARAVMLETFRWGPNVVLELLDQLPDAGASEDLSQVIAELTERPLPAVRASEWMRAARLALLGHLLQLRRGDDAELDLLASALTEVIRERHMLLPRAAMEIAPANASPQEAMERLVDAWRERAGSSLSTRPTPAPLPELDRRRALRRQVAHGGIVSFVAEQVAHLELTAYAIAAQAPWLAGDLDTILQKAFEERAASPSALAQAMGTELALSRVWELAFVGDAATAVVGEGGEDPAGRKGPNDDMAPSSPSGPLAAPGPGGAPSQPASPGDRGAPTLTKPREQAPVPPPGVEPPTQRDPPTR